MSSSLAWASVELLVLRSIIALVAWALVRAFSIGTSAISSRA